MGLLPKQNLSVNFTWFRSPIGRQKPELEASLKVVDKWQATIHEARPNSPKRTFQPANFPSRSHSYGTDKVLNAVQKAVDERCWINHVMTVLKKY